MCMHGGALGTMGSEDLACINGFFTPPKIAKNAKRHAGVASVKDKFIRFLSVVLTQCAAELLP